MIRSYGGWDSVTELRREYEVRIGDERILGDSDFVLAVLKMDELMVNKKTNWQQLGWDLKRLVNAETYES